MKRFAFLFLLFAPLFISNLEGKRYVGGDISLLQSYEDNNVMYYDQKGLRKRDLIQYMKSEDVGWNALRVRLFVNPEKKDANGNADPQVCQDLDYVVRLCKRIKSEGFSLLLDFHYSDTWADPSNQWTPAAWLSLSASELRTKVYEYTKECLQRLVDEGAAPDFIQTGNEISYGMLWGAVNYDSNVNRCYSNSPNSYWTRFINLLNQAVKACREVCPQAQVVIHSERVANSGTLKNFYTRLSDVDYDIIGLSYYPFWHNSLSVLSSSLDMLAKDFPNKTVQIVETAYYYQGSPTHDYDFTSVWPYTPDGQKAYAEDLIAELKKHSNVNALYWWFPEENGSGPSNAVLLKWVNRGLWNNSTHRALPALFVLKDYLDEESMGVADVVDEEESGIVFYYDLQGRRIENPSSGIFIERRGNRTRKVLF